MFFRYFGRFQYTLHFADRDHWHEAEEEQYTGGENPDCADIDANFNPGR
jgi:hypothetical protein